MKQYLMICDERGMEILKNAFRQESVQFLEVQGMNMGETNQFSLLVTPVLPPVNRAVISQEGAPEPEPKPT